MSHSPALATGLTAGGVDLTTTDLRILMRVTQGLWDSLEFRGVDTVVPSAPGRVARNRVADQRIIVAEGYVMGAGAGEAAQRADLLSIRQTIDGLMRQDQTRYTLTVTNEDGSEISITVQPLRVEWGDDSIPSLRTAACYWLAVDSPDWEGEGS